jgi:hypothetical protein
LPSYRYRKVFHPIDAFWYLLYQYKTAHINYVEPRNRLHQFHQTIQAFYSQLFDNKPEKIIGIPFPGIFIFITNTRNYQFWTIIKQVAPTGKRA